MSVCSFFVMKLYKLVWLYVIVYSCVWSAIIILYSDIVYQNANQGLKTVERFFNNDKSNHGLNCIYTFSSYDDYSS